MRQRALETLMELTTAYVQGHRRLRDFAPWPEQPHYQEKPATYIPVARIISQWQVDGDSDEAELHEAMRSAVNDLYWKQTYTESEVGPDFLARYGYFELLGSDGHFFCDTVRAYFGFWGSGLKYDWHHHEAEEIYCILSGSAEFHLQDDRSLFLSRRDTRYHKSDQPHAMNTSLDPVLALILWRGQGIGGLPVMGGS